MGHAEKKPFGNADMLCDMYVSGYTILELRDFFGLEEYIVTGILKARGIFIDPSNEATLRKAPKVQHHHDEIRDPETGKIYYDITDYVIDCGLGVRASGE